MAHVTPNRRLIPFGFVPNRKSAPSVASDWLGPFQNRSRVRPKHVVDSNYGHLMFYRLTDKHPVKRITVNERKGGELLNTGLIKGQVGNLMSFALGRQMGFRRRRHRKLAELVLEDRFP